MRTKYAFVLATVAILFAVSAAPGAPPLASLLRAHTQELMDALAPGTKSVWDRYLDDGAIITAEDGSLQTKQQMLRDLRPLPEGVSGKIVVQDFQVHPHGAAVIANYIIDEHENYHGQMLHCQYRTTDTWLRSGGDWHIIASQVLALRADPPAIQLPPSLEGEYAGRYALTPSIEYEIRRGTAGLEGRRSGGKWEPLLAEAPDVLFVPGQPRYRKVIQRDAAHKITGFVDRREAWDLLWKRVNGRPE